VEVQTGTRQAEPLKLKCGFCTDEVALEKLDGAPTEGRPLHQWVRGEEGWEQVF
jgi:hypothetical protein